MKIAHLIPAHHIFTKGRVAFLHNNFQEYKFHTYIFESFREKTTINETGTVTIIPHAKPKVKAEIIYDIISQYDKVIFDSSFLAPVEKLFLIFKLNGNYRKLVWIEWGHDLFLAEPLNFIDFIKIKIKGILQSIFEKRIPEFVAIYPTDIIYYKQHLKGKANVYFAPYRENKIVWDLRPSTTINDKLASGSPVTIQICHRAEPFLRHKDILNMLAPYAKENIRIHLPLSYGIKSYAEDVAQYAKSIFGDKVIYLKDVIPYDEYTKLLNDVDIFILNSKRQIALGNVHQFLQKGKKIYLPKDSILSIYYKQHGVEIADIESLSIDGYAGLISDMDYSKGQKWMWEYDQNDPVVLWKEVFKQILN